MPRAVAKTSPFKRIARGGEQQRVGSVILSAPQDLQTAFLRLDEQSFGGFVCDRGDLLRKFAVEILVDGHPVRLVHADSPSHELVRQRVGDGCYGFTTALSGRIIRDSGCVEARLANLGTPIGAPLLLEAPSPDERDPLGAGEARWLGGLRFSGWARDLSDVAHLRAEVDGVPVARIAGSGWRHIGCADAARPARGFDFHLPRRFADGIVHRLSIFSECDEPLEGTPIAFLAYPGGFRDAFASERTSFLDSAVEYLDRLMPISAPFSHYAAWRDQISLTDEATSGARIAVVMVGPGAMSDTVESLEAQGHRDWTAAALPPSGGVSSFQPALVNELLRAEAAESEIVVCGLAGSLLAPSALQRIANVFAENPRISVVYGDLELQSADGAAWPLALPAFDYERMLEQGYCALFFSMRREIFERALDSAATNLFRLFNATLDLDHSAHLGIAHLPGALATLPTLDVETLTRELAQASRVHLRRRGVAAKAGCAAGGALPAVRITRSFGSPRTSVIIPTRNRAELLRTCLSSIAPALAKAGAELLIIDNDSQDSESLDYLSDLENEGARVLRAPGPFNYAALMNQAVEAATGEIICLLNNDVKAFEDSWLEEMLGRISDPKVGAVGAMLIWPSGVVQHGGVVLGPSFAAAHAFNDRLANDEGYADLLRVAHECSAATAACLLLRRRDYLNVGGMDAAGFPINFNDVDLCLKLRANGARIVFTPYAKLEHLESASRGRDHGPDRHGRFERELRLLRAKWGDILADDPYYSPLLSLDPIPFSALAWPVRRVAPRTNLPPIARAVPPGF